jgi:hypothetical protein
MRKRLILAAFVGALVLLIGAGCQLQVWSDLYGTWERDVSGTHEVLTFGPFNANLEQSGATTGTVKWSIKDVNENLYHVLLNVTSGTGAWSAATPDDPVAMTYEISSDGEILYINWNWDSTSYPASGHGFGPFTKS